MFAIAWLAPVFFAMACTTTAPQEPVAGLKAQIDTLGTNSEADDETVLYTCNTEAGSPYDTIRISKYDVEIDEKNADEDEVTQVRGGAGSIASGSEMSVLIEFNGGSQSSVGKCTIVSGKLTACKDSDANLSLLWSDKKTPSGAESVHVEEAWFLTSKKFKASCLPRSI